MFKLDMLAHYSWVYSMESDRREALGGDDTDNFGRLELEALAVMRLREVIKANLFRNIKVSGNYPWMRPVKTASTTSGSTWHTNGGPVCGTSFRRSLSPMLMVICPRKWTTSRYGRWASFYTAPKNFNTVDAFLNGPAVRNYVKRKWYFRGCLIFDILLRGIAAIELVESRAVWILASYVANFQCSEIVAVFYPYLLMIIY
jgi:hypothetical protein